jgi:mediator of RNA polymerase II transcription subunit 24
LEFLISIVDAITCRTKPEESSLMNAILSLLHWLIELSEKIFLKVMEQNKIATCEQQECLNKIAQFSQRIVSSQYLMGVIYLAKLEDRELYEKCIISYKKIHGIPCKDEVIVKNIYLMVYVKFDHMPMKEFDTREVEPICFGLQPFM